MHQLKGQDLVDLSRVVSIPAEMPTHYGLKSGARNVRPREVLRVEQHLPNICGKGVTVPDSKMKWLMPPEEDTLEMKSRERTIDSRQPHRHAVVVGILRFERE